MASDRCYTYAYIERGANSGLYRVASGFKDRDNTNPLWRPSLMAFENLSVEILHEDRCFAIGEVCSADLGWAERHAVAAVVLHENELQDGSATWISRLTEGPLVFSTMSKGRGEYECSFCAPLFEVREPGDQAGLINLTWFELSDEFHDESLDALEISHKHRTTIIFPVTEGTLIADVFDSFTGFGDELALADQIVLADFARLEIRSFDSAGEKLPMDIDACCAFREYLRHTGVGVDTLNSFRDRNFRGTYLQLEAEESRNALWVKTVVKTGNQFEIRKMI